MILVPNFTARQAGSIWHGFRVSSLRKQSENKSFHPPDAAPIVPGGRLDNAHRTTRLLGVSCGYLRNGSGSDFDPDSETVIIRKISHTKTHVLEISGPSDPSRILRDLAPPRAAAPARHGDVRHHLHINIVKGKLGRKTHSDLRRFPQRSPSIKACAHDVKAKCYTETSPPTKAIYYNVLTWDCQTALATLQLPRLVFY